MIYTKETLNILKDNFSFIKETYSHYIVRCLYCGDSKKHRNKGHLYISKIKPVFRCVRCEESGRIEKLLFDLTGVKKRITTVINKDAIKKLNKMHLEEVNFNRTFKKNIIVPEQEPDKFKMKYNYLIDRFPTTKIFEQLDGKIIYDIKDFAEKNFIKIHKRKLFNFFQENFVGFLSFNKSLVIMRNIDSKSDFRYYIWKLGDVVNDFFIQDKLEEETNNVSLVISEGLFDIFNVLHFEDSHDLYTVASGKLFNRAIKFTMVEKCVSFFDKIIILSDDDVHLNFYKKNLNKYKNVCKSMQIWYNKHGKDFGQKTKVDKIILKMK